MNTVTFNRATRGIQSLIVSFAIIAGAAWTFYTFSILGTAEKAKWELFKQPVFNIDLDAEQSSLQGDDTLYIKGVTTVTNKGNRNSLLSDGKPVVTVFKANFQGLATTRSQAVGQFELDPGSVIRAGATEQFPFLIKLSEPGFYYVEFYVKASQEDLNIYTSAGGAPSNDVAWIAGAFVPVSCNCPKEPDKD